MLEYFEIVKEVSRDDLTKAFKDHESTRPEGSDTNAQERIEELESKDVLSYYKCRLTEEALNNLILPYHVHDDVTTTKLGGDNLSVVMHDVVSKWPNSVCGKKIADIKARMFGPSVRFWDPGFLLLSNDKNLAHPGNDHYEEFTWKNKLFIFNGFHRLVAYGLALQELGKFAPIEVYYGENKNI